MFATTIAFIGGILLGILFFGGLWLTVKKALTAKLPVLWFLGSMILRVSIALIGFYYFAHGNLFDLLMCLLGFLIGRYAILRYTKILDRKNWELKKEP
jgi:F1F0 ATPase subunit 2